VEVFKQLEGDAHSTRMLPSSRVTKKRIPNAENLCLNEKERSYVYDQIQQETEVKPLTIN